MFVYGGEKPKVYGPRWKRLEDAPEKIRHLLVEADDVQDDVLKYIPDALKIEVRVWKRLWWDHEQATTTKDAFWETVQSLADQIISEQDEPVVLSDVWIMKIKGNGWCWDFGSDGLPVDKDDDAHIRTHMLDLHDVENIALAARIMTLFSNIRAWYTR